MAENNVKFTLKVCHPHENNTNFLPNKLVAFHML